MTPDSTSSAPLHGPNLELAILEIDDEWSCHSGSRSCDDGAWEGAEPVLNHGCVVDVEVTRRA